MQRMNRTSNTPRFVPDYRAQSLMDIDFELLAQAGVKYVAFDADNTLVPYFGVQLSEKTRKHLVIQLDQFAGWCVASNRITNNLTPLAESFGATVIHAGIFIRKPKKRYFKKVIKHFKARPHEVAMIGDKLVTDIWGAKRVGLQTVWVERIGKDMFIERLFRTRWFERMLLRRYAPGMTK